MNEPQPTALASIMGSSLNAENARTQKMKTVKPRKKRRISRAVLEPRKRPGLGVRDLIGL